MLKKKYIVVVFAVVSVLVGSLLYNNLVSAGKPAPESIPVEVTNFPSKLHETYEWGAWLTIPADTTLWIINETRGYERVTITFANVFYADLHFRIYFKTEGASIVYLDSGIAHNEQYHQTFSVEGAELQIELMPNDNIEIYVTLYMTT